MFRELRRKKQLLSRSVAEDILNRKSSGVLALSGDDSYPYAVPLSYVFDGETLCFHCAKAGHKLDAIRHSEKASFCVIDKDEVVPEEYTTYFRSVIAFGRVRILENEREKRAALEKLALKYAPDSTQEERHGEIQREWPHVCVLEMKIEHMTGKEAIELVRARP
ncbi:MAG: pyridoxamine 5'-phosphate oxidase family protein [Lawsonibacter sp.]|nr:pyridoxamine 5'-phosphate oxidase family protein [Lawsonibacter sp.]